MYWSASVVSNQFDAEPKRWRLISSLALDASMFLELLTPLVPAYFLLLASIANVGERNRLLVLQEGPRFDYVRQEHLFPSSECIESGDSSFVCDSRESRGYYR
jgi:hypothetical protein